ncbi:MAG TPA: class I SAM-dependent methyltransferase [Thermoanaerobaculia bacterium]|jgi:SAM-dependent methyltransferase|nr:class I SAM-dependent methyltransferase [Thermoanaerobaculia bacterium]
MLEPFIYEFGYDWPWTRGHLLLLVSFGTLFGVACWRRWPRWIAAVGGVFSAWALAGALIVHYVLDFNRPMRLPTAAFLPIGEGRVLDAGAGSGRATVAVLRERPRSTVTALDIYSDYFGISDNTPKRLHTNARIAGVEPRVEVVTGDMRAMPLPSSSFAAALSVAAIDHLGRDDVATALREIERVLEPGGQFLLVTVNVDPWLRVAMPLPHAHGYFSVKQRVERWRGLIEDAGLEVTEEGTRPGTLYLLARKPG